MNWKNFLIVSFKILFTLFVVLGIGLIVIDSIIHTATGDSYTPEKWWNAEQYYCATQGMEAHQYISNQCSLFGCVDIEKTKCVGENKEKMINYKDKIFCQYSLSGDLGLC